MTAPGRPERSYAVTLAEGQHQVLTVEPAAVPVSRSVVAAPRNEWRPAGFAIGGVGLATLGVAGVTGILAIAKKNQLAAMCPDPDACTKKGVQLAQSGAALGTACTITFVAGLVTTGAGATILLVKGRDTKGKANVQASIHPGRVLLHGRF